MFPEALARAQPGAAEKGLLRARAGGTGEAACSHPDSQDHCGPDRTETYPEGTKQTAMAERRSSVGGQARAATLASTQRTAQTWSRRGKAREGASCRDIQHHHVPSNGA